MHAQCAPLLRIIICTCIFSSLRPSVSSVELQQWATSLLPGHEAIASIIDYSYTVPYSFEAGVDVSIVSLYNVPDTGLFSSKTMLFKVRRCQVDKRLRITVFQSGDILHESAGHILPRLPTSRRCALYYGLRFRHQLESTRIS